MKTDSPLLRVQNLDVTYGKGRKAFQAVNNVSFDIQSGETLGVVGESGSGKSTVGRAILGLAKTSGGHIAFAGKDITALGRKGRKALSANLQVVFQDPRSSLNEAKNVGSILTEPLVSNRLMKKAEAESRARELLVQVGLTAEDMTKYPGSFSGGQRQRVAIARALMSRPQLVICDEPVSALDVSVQAQIVNLFRKLQKETGVSYLFIAHDLSIVRLLSERILVMKKGTVVEQGGTESVYNNPTHPYTQRLLAAEPYPHPVVQKQRRREWEALADQAP